MPNDTSPSGKKLRTRSPAYPAIDLEEAVNKASALWKRASRHPVQADVAVTFWGYDEGSSTGLSALSALKKFGLVDDSGSGNQREVKLTDLGIALVFNPDVSSESYASNLKQAALLPTIHAELWEKYGGQLPDDSIIERYLVVEKRFNEQYVKTFIDELKKTITFAKLTAGDMVLETQVPTNVQAGVTVQSVPTVARANLSAHAESSASVSPALVHAAAELPIPLDDGRVARIPYPMSEDTFELLVQSLALWKRRLVKTSSTAGVRTPLDTDKEG